MGMVYLFSIPVLFLAWALVYPHEALSLIAKLKRRTNLYIVRRESQQAAHRLAHEFRARAGRLGYDPKLVDEILNENLQKSPNSLSENILANILAQHKKGPMRNLSPALEQARQRLVEPGLGLRRNKA
jgi:hypothetical protein